MKNKKYADSIFILHYCIGSNCICSWIF